jgi:hypothetical protein
LRSFPQTSGHVLTRGVDLKRKVLADDKAVDSHSPTLP